MLETQETWLPSLGQEDPLESMATHSSILAWRIPSAEGPGGLQFMWLQRVAQLSEQLNIPIWKVSACKEDDQPSEKATYEIGETFANQMSKRGLISKVIPT